MNAGIIQGWSTIKPSLGRSILVAGLAALWLAAGCGTDPPNNATACTVDADCPSNEYCSDGGTCSQDCTGDAECSGSEICTSRGRCIGGSCTADEDCPEDYHCGGEGVCEQECNPAGSGQCPTGQQCTSRGRCQSTGECASDDDCTAAPNDTCDGDVLVTYAEQGSCEGEGEQRSCEYPASETSCQYGCADGECEPNPCEGVTCDSPPEASCEGDTLVEYEGGTCDPTTGECTYQETETGCANGCSGGACNTGGCTADSCTSPPEPECMENTAVTYGSEDTWQCNETEDGTKCDYNAQFDNCSYVGGECMDASCQNAVSETGDLVITEVMGDPGAVEDYQGEWFEVYNPGSSAIDLQGWTIRGGSDEESHRIEESVEVGAESRIWMATSDDPAGDGSLTPDYVYSNVGLANTGDSIQLVDPDGDVADHIYWELGALLEGASRKLGGAVSKTASANNQYENLCPSLDPENVYGEGDVGTPGEPNGECNAAPCSAYQCQRPTAFCDDGEAVHPTKESASCEKTRFNNPRCDFGVEKVNCTDSQLCVSGFCEDLPTGDAQPAEGELVITEIMGNPSEVNDTKGEWIEIYNPTGSEKSLFSVVLADSESGNLKDEYTVENQSARVPSEGYMVLAREPDSSQNGGVEDAFNYDGSHLKNSPDSGMTLRLVRQDGTVVDEAPYLEPTEGAAQQLSSGSLDASANDDEANWCDATSSYGSGSDKGTPGAENEACQ